MQEIDEYLGLSEDPELAFVEYEKLLRDRLENKLMENPGVFVSRGLQIEYVSRLMAFHDVHSFRVLHKPVLNRRSDDFDELFEEFLDNVEYCATKIKISQAQRLRHISTILQLTPDLRKQLHSYISKIRETVATVDISQNKKDAIFRKINALAEEIDRDRTKAEALTALTLELSSAAGQAAKDLEPTKKIIDAITNLLGKVKEISDRTLGLPSPPSQKQIEGPRKQLQSPTEASSDDDDEIPF